MSVPDESDIFAQDFLQGCEWSKEWALAWLKEPDFNAWGRGKTFAVLSDIPHRQLLFGWAAPVEIITPNESFGRLSAIGMRLPKPEIEITW